MTVSVFLCVLGNHATGMRDSIVSHSLYKTGFCPKAASNKRNYFC